MDIDITPEPEHKPITPIDREAYLRSKKAILSKLELQALFPTITELWREVNIANYAQVMQELHPEDWLPKLEREFGGKIYGGYMENRGPLFGEDSGQIPTLHLGVDIWLPAGTPISFPFNGVVISSNHNSQERSGWGGKLDILSDGHIWSFGHLKKPSLQARHIVRANTEIGILGSREENGGWLPHLHLQCTTMEHFSTLTSPDDLEAYASPSPKLCRTFLNPLADN